MANRHDPRDLGRDLPRRERSARRDLLVALNACLELDRDAVCRLALRPNAWTGPHGAASRTRLVDELGVRRADLTISRRLARRPGVAAAEEIDKAARVGASLVTLVDPGYPTALLDLELPPPVLYLKGRLPERPAVAIVGSRQADPYGLEAGELFGRELARQGLTIVSGLARGVDAAAHRGALDAIDGRTVAVQACGLDSVYPRNHTRLAERIAGRGAVLSEFPIGTAPVARNFPVRNRLIAALSVGTLVIQAARRSGSLITARLALDLGRDVYAVPGPIFNKRAVGTNELVRDGALMALAPRDILEALPLAVRDRLESEARELDRPGPEGAEGVLQTVLALLSERAEMAPDEIAAEASLGIDEVLAALLQLELGGRVRRHPGPTFHIRPGDRPG